MATGVGTVHVGDLGPLHGLTHRDGPLGRLHEAYVNVQRESSRGQHPLACYDADDDSGALTLMRAAAKVLGVPGNFETRGMDFLLDRVRNY